MVTFSSLKTHYNIQVDFGFNKIDKESIDVHTDDNLLCIKAADAEEPDNKQSVDLYLPNLSTEEPTVSIQGNTIVIQAKKKLD